ncbi:MAG: hypothetical protein R3C99_20860 [Pirellulaceae bacterium]
MQLAISDISTAERWPKLLAADEQPVLAANGYRLHTTFGDIVSKIAVVDITIQGDPLIASVRCRLADLGSWAAAVVRRAIVPAESATERRVRRAAVVAAPVSSFAAFDLIQSRENDCPAHDARRIVF